MKHKTPKLNKIFATLVAACLVLGLLPLVTMPPAQATNYWDNWTEISSLNIAAGSTEAARTLTNGNFKVTANTTIPASSTAGRSGLFISGTVTIYIAPAVTLTVNGANGSGTTGDGAGIRLPSGATLILRGGGTVNATGGNGGSANYNSKTHNEQNFR